VAAAAAAAMPACATATGEVTGGESLYDGAVAPAPEVDSGPVDSDTPEGSTKDAADANLPPATWTELYKDYFGPAGAASCAGNGTCHGDMSQLGYMTSGYLCPPADQNGCYTGIVSPSAGLVMPGNGVPFPMTYLYTVIRKSVGTNIALDMPKSPVYSFTPDDIARISSWVAAGAKND
jgi:hypothetical protein